MKLLSADAREHYGEFRYAGDVSVPALVEALTHVNSYCQAHALKGAFVDLTEATGTLSGTERFELARTLVSRWNRGVAVAILNTAAQHMPGRPGQLVAQNQGFRVRVFTERVAAIAWLQIASQ